MDMASRSARSNPANPLFTLLIAALLAGCGGGDEGTGQGARAAESAHGGPGGSRPPAPVAIAPATVGDIASHYVATATLAAEKEAEILARVAGVAGRLHAEEGDQVRTGDLLLTVDAHEYALRLEQAEAATANLTARHERAEGMLAKNLISAEEFEQIKADLKSARADEGLARLDLSYTRVLAPFSGRITSRMVDVGQNISVGTPLFVLADFEPLLARVHVPSREFRQLEIDQEVELVLDSSEKRLKGRIKLVSPVIDPSSGTIKLTIEVPDHPADTRPGDFAEVRIVTERRTGTTLVPKVALVTDRGEQVVFVAADSTAERRVVEVGFEDDRSAEIVGGVQPGDLVIVKGQRSLKHGAPIKVIDGGAFGGGARPPRPRPPHGAAADSLRRGKPGERRPPHGQRPAGAGG
jgi:membrane fusion protein (multidrug efflux system)